jgi:hypothetical protein
VWGTQQQTGRLASSQVPAISAPAIAAETCSDRSTSTILNFPLFGLLGAIRAPVFNSGKAAASCRVPRARLPWAGNVSGG